jgi:very-short-patch-repair endonuclease
MQTHDNRTLLDRRRELRQNQTKAEEILWWYLRDRKMEVKFKRQHGVGGYIADFYCAEKKIIIELDGEIHNTKEARQNDTVRDKYFTELGYIILRFLNNDVEDRNKIERVLEQITDCIDKTKSRLKV